MSRALKVGEEYAIRLLMSNPDYPPDQAREVARALVEDYPDHGFVIDAEEAR
jgi:GTP cyclohydrolase FolE2